MFKVKSLKEPEGEVSSPAGLKTPAFGVYEVNSVVVILDCQLDET